MPTGRLRPRNLMPRRYEEFAAARISKGDYEVMVALSQLHEHSLSKELQAAVSAHVRANRHLVNKLPTVQVVRRNYGGPHGSS